MWTRTDQTQIPPKHIPQLRQLIQAVLAQESTQRRNSRVFGDLECDCVPFIETPQGVLYRFGVRHHRAELMAAKCCSFSSHSKRLMKNRTLRVEFYQQCDQHQNG